MAVKFNVEVSASTIILLILNFLILAALIFGALQITHLKNAIDHQNKTVQDAHAQIEIDKHFKNEFFKDDVLPKKRPGFHRFSKFKNHPKDMGLRKEKPLKTD